MSTSTTQPIIETPTHIVRRHLHSDAESLTRSLDDHEITRWMTDRIAFPYTLDLAHEFIHHLDSQPEPRVDFVVVDKSTGDAVGGVGLKMNTDVHRRTVELGYWLARQSWGQGIMSTLVPRFLKWTFEQFPEVNRVEAQVFEGNEASIKVLEKHGFRQEGVLRGKVWKEGKMMDLYIFGLLRDDFQVGSG